MLKSAIVLLGGGRVLGRAVLLAAAGCEVAGPEATARVVWSINGDGSIGCPTLDTCEDVGAESVRARYLDAPSGETPDDALWPCGGDYGEVITGLASGSYRIGLVLVNVAAEPLTVEIERTLDFGAEGGEDMCVDFPASSFLTPREGVFAFTTTWGGLSCAGARVATAVIDGEQRACTDEAQALGERTWGPATLEVAGLDEDGRTCYEAEFDVVIGAGDNPAVALDVAAAEPGCE